MLSTQSLTLRFLEQANAGVVQSVKNSFGQGTGWLAPIVLGYMTQYPMVEGVGRLSREEWEALPEGSPPESWVVAMGLSWSRVFVSAAAIEVAGVVAFTLLGRGDRQWWDLRVVK